MIKGAGAVLAGYISIGILVILTDLTLGRLFPDAYGHGKMPPSSLLAVSMITATIYSAGGGWITAWLAPHNPWKLVWWLVGFGEFMGVVSMIAFWGQQPLWYPIALLILYPPAVWLGGRIRLGAPASS